MLKHRPDLQKDFRPHHMHHHKQYLLKQQLQQKATKLGFAEMGVARADFLQEEAPRLEQWLQQGKHGQMRWMENHFDKRLDPRLLVPGAKTVVSFMLNYFPQQEQPVEAPKIARYAYGHDYHHVIKGKLRQLTDWLEETHGSINGRVFVDSAPVMERQWAQRSGLGWQGKNTLTLSKQRGSYYFLAELISDLEFPADAPATDHCGSCTRCIDACPTEAITPYSVDASKCISYLTIELKEAMPAAFADKLEGWAFGCDICQEVCPWNRFSQPQQVEELKPPQLLYELNTKEWQELTKETFQQLFKKSAVKRAGFAKLKNSIEAATSAPRSN
jgi:epoxyqueuosine reductase